MGFLAARKFKTVAQSKVVINIDLSDNGPPTGNEYEADSNEEPDVEDLMPKLDLEELDDAPKSTKKSTKKPAPKDKAPKTKSTAKARALSDGPKPVARGKGSKIPQPKSKANVSKTSSSKERETTPDPVDMADAELAPITLAAVIQIIKGRHKS